MSHGCYLWSFGITIDNGESVKSGSFNFKSSHVFDQSKKITKIVTTVRENEVVIAQINFFSGEELLCEVGWTGYYNGRVESFEIAADEQLIGAELYNQTYEDG